MIRIWHLDEVWADVEVLGGKLHVIAEVDDEASAWDLLESMRIDGETGKKRTDQELYDSLTTRLQGHVWARYVDKRLDCPTF